MAEVTLTQMLEARERRASAQRALLAEYHTPIVCFTMNIAGPIKNSPLIERAFYEGIHELQKRLPSPLSRKIHVSDTGCEALWAISLPAAELKGICTTLEEETALGRLFDIDVLNERGEKLERAVERGCLVCGASGRACAAGRLHSVKELQDTTTRIITEYFLQRDKKHLAALAVQSLLDEVYTTPKPGLVDRRNNGSHKDMDLALFEKSAHALLPYFEECIRIGQAGADDLPENTFAQLRKAGIVAENAMFSATNGVNTHKGAIYSFGVLCGAVGRLWSAANPIAERSRLLAECTALTQESVKEDFATANADTAGLRCYRENGIKGIRGEVAAGFPSVVNFSLPALEAVNGNGVWALVMLIANVREDTALYHRGGDSGVAFAVEYARQLLLQPSVQIQDLEAMDDAFIARNLSPGGCADLLAVSYFLYHLEAYKKSITDG